MQQIRLDPSADCDSAIEGALNALSATGGLLELGGGLWPRHRTVTIPTTSQPIAVRGLGRDLTKMVSDPGIIAFQYDHQGPGMRPALSFADLGFYGAGRALRLVPNNNGGDPTTFLTSVHLDRLAFDSNKSWSVEVRGSMGTRINDYTARGCENVFFVGDCGEISIGDALDENCGIGIMFSGSGVPGLPEGPVISRWTSNGAILPLVVDNYAFITGTALQLTSSRGPSVLIRGRSQNIFLDGVFGGLHGQSDAIHIEPTALGDPNARAERIRISGMVYGSEFGLVARHVNELEVDATFCTQNNVDLYLDDCHNHRIAITATSDPGPGAAKVNVIETGSCRNGRFIGCATRYPMALQGTSVQVGSTGLA